MSKPEAAGDNETQTTELLELPTSPDDIEKLKGVRRFVAEHHKLWSHALFFEGRESRTAILCATEGQILYARWLLGGSCILTRGPRVTFEGTDYFTVIADDKQDFYDALVGVELTLSN